MAAASASQPEHCGACGLNADAPGVGGGRGRHFFLGRGVTTFRVRGAVAADGNNTAALAADTDGQRMRAARTDDVTRPHLGGAGGEALGLCQRLHQVVRSFQMDIADVLKRAGAEQAVTNLLRFVPPPPGPHLSTAEDKLNVTRHLGHVLDVQLAVLARLCHHVDDVVQEMSRERQKSARIARESKAALARLTADHAAQTADLQHQLRETEALVDEAASATTPLYMWPSADGMRVLKSKYDQLHEAHVHLQAVHQDTLEELRTTQEEQQRVVARMEDLECRLYSLPPYTQQTLLPPQAPLSLPPPTPPTLIAATETTETATTATATVGAAAAEEEGEAPGDLPLRPTGPHVLPRASQPDLSTSVMGGRNSTTTTAATIYDAAAEWDNHTGDDSGDLMLRGTAHVASLRPRASSASIGLTAPYRALQTAASERLASMQGMRLASLLAAYVVRKRGEAVLADVRHTFRLNGRLQRHHMMRVANWADRHQHAWTHKLRQLQIVQQQLSLYAVRETPGLQPALRANVVAAAPAAAGTGGAKAPGDAGERYVRWLHDFWVAPGDGESASNPNEHDAASDARAWHVTPRLLAMQAERAAQGHEARRRPPSGIRPRPFSNTGPLRQQPRSSMPASSITGEDLLGALGSVTTPLRSASATVVSRTRPSPQRHAPPQARSAILPALLVGTQ